MSCEVCPGPEGREVSKVVGARNMSECGGKIQRKKRNCRKDFFKRVCCWLNRETTPVLKGNLLMFETPAHKENSLFVGLSIINGDILYNSLSINTMKRQKLASKCEVNNM